MTDFEVSFKDSMFVYAAESATNPSKLKVTIPEIFLDKKTNTVESIRVAKGNSNIYLNENPPALANSVMSLNYIELPVIGSFAGSGTYGSHKINVTSGIGSIRAGDRLIAQFIGNCPFNGVIIGRC